MTVFKTFLKLVNKNKGQLILYTALLIVFTCITLSNDQVNISYSDAKPDVIIIDSDNSKLSNHLKEYFKQHANVKEYVDNIDDELFYRFSSYAIYIPSGFENSVINKNTEEIEYKSTGDYEANLANILLNKYLISLGAYEDSFNNIDDLINHIDKSLENKTNMIVSSSLNTDQLAKAKFYYSFMNYSLLAGCIYVLVVIISIFRNKNILKRNIVSSINFNKFNWKLLASSLVFGILVWFIYVLLSFVVVGNIMFTSNGLCMIGLSFVFLIYCLSIGFLISNLLNNKGAINGIITTISLGTSFLCGAFIQLEFLPTSVLNVSKMIPNYYYIDAINKIATIEKVSLESLRIVSFNIIILLLASLVFIVSSILISRKKRKLA